jgi:hypothetical protein
MGRIFDAMKSFFEADDWKFQPLDDDPALRMAFAGDDGSWTCIARAREKEEQFIFYSYFPVKVSEERRAAMGEFLTRANYGMIIGNFELDLSDGEVRYKTSIDVEDSELSHALAKHIVYANVLTMDRYYKGLVAVAGGGMTPVEAIKSIES